jgi:hypothetical protein
LETNPRDPDQCQNLTESEYCKKKNKAKEMFDVHERPAVHVGNNYKEAELWSRRKSLIYKKITNAYKENYLHCIQHTVVFYLPILYSYSQLNYLKKRLHVP